MSLWLRELGNFGGWAVLIWVLSYLAEANLSLGWSLVARFFIFWSAILWTLRAEWLEYRDERQDQGKTIWDLIAKPGGIVVASLTAGWWRVL